MPTLRAKAKQQKLRSEKKFQPKGKAKGRSSATKKPRHNAKKGRRHEDSDESELDDEVYDDDAEDFDEISGESGESDHDDDVEEKATESKKHKSDLKKLKQKDPEFYEFLQENDADLLDFDDEEDFEEEDFDGESSQYGVVQKEELTSSVLKSTIERARKGQLKDIKLLQGMFRLASNPTIDSEEGDEEEDSAKGIPFTISSPEIYEEVMTSAILNVHFAWAQFLNTSLPMSSKTISKLGEIKKYKKIQSLVLNFFKTIVSMLQSIGTIDRHHQVTIFLLQNLEKYIPFIGPLPRLTRGMAKVLSNLLTARINDNVQNEDNNHNFSDIRGQALLRLRQMSMQLPGNASEECFRLVYLHFARTCKTCTEMNAENISLVIRCITELYKSDASMAYQEAFLYIRQLALHLRLAFIKQGDKAIAPVRSWQYVHCLRLWTSVISAMPREDRGLVVLVYPLMQIMQGMLTAIQSPYYAPLRFHLTRLAHQLAAHSQMFLPMSLPLTELLEYQEFFNKPTASTSAPPKLSFLLALPPNTWGHKVVRETVLHEIVQLLRMEAELYKSHPGFPEYAFIIQRRLRTFAKKTTIGQHRDITRVLADQLGDMSSVNTKKRQVEGCIPVETVVFEPLLDDGMPSAVERISKKGPQFSIASLVRNRGPKVVETKKVGKDIPLKSALKKTTAKIVESKNNSDSNEMDSEDSDSSESDIEDQSSSDASEASNSFHGDEVGEFDEDEF